MPRAAALVIGNELLTGKIQDSNTRYLAKTLFGLGISLERVLVVPDDVEGIARDLRALSDDFDFVFTSGGVGPTHDDLTLIAVALCFGVPIVRSEEMAARIQSHFGERTTEAHLRMADMPEGARLVRGEANMWPTIAIENVFVLPGVPQIFQRKLDALRPVLDTGNGFVSHAVYTNADEGSVADLLAAIVKAHPDVLVGSYPQMPGAADHRVKLTFDARDGEAARAAADAFIAALSPELFLRREPDVDAS